MKNAFVSALIEIATKDKNVFLITADLGFGVLDRFQNLFPAQFINAGISEQNMTSIATGLAMEGKTVFTYSIANFSTLRCLEQIRNDVCYHNANVKIISVGAGFSYGALGMSHHATEDISIMRALPNMIVMSPSNSLETLQATDLIYKQKSPCYMRLGNDRSCKLHSDNANLKIGEAIMIKPATDLVIFATGAIINEAILAVDELSNIGIDVGLFSFSTVKPIDRETILKVANFASVIISLEEHNNVGGFGSAISEVMSSSHVKALLIRIGLEDTYANITGSQNYLLDYYGISAAKIVCKIKEILNK